MKIAVIGATGAVGREILKDLEACPLPDIELTALASFRSEGQMVAFRGRRVRVEAYRPELLRGCSYALMSAGGAFSREQARSIGELGCTVIDNSSAWRMDPEVPLVVPEINADLLAHRPEVRIIANPNCSTIQMCVALAPLQKRFGLEQVHVSTYQSVSGSGQKGIDELSRQVQGSLKFAESAPQLYEQTIAFNVLGAIGALGADGYCEEEEKMVRETRKILRAPELLVIPTAVRVPVFHCHSEAVTVCLGRAVTLDEVLSAWHDAGPGLVYEPATSIAALPSPRRHAGRAEVFVSRPRLPYGQEKSPWVVFWNVADNLKKGAATNAVQILEALVRLR